MYHEEKNKVKPTENTLAIHAKLPVPWIPLIIVYFNINETYPVKDLKFQKAWVFISGQIKSIKIFNTKF